jgi:pyruvate dehydrogenase E2 component (dihydrolipoyllysine-residue acetyltransferase)
MLKDVKIPEISENVTSGSIVEVLVKVGDTVAVDDVLVEMETEKAVVEIPSPYAGKISEVLVEAGDEKNVGDVIVRIETDNGAAGQEDEDGAAQAQEAAAVEDRQAAVPADKQEDLEDSQEAKGKDDAVQGEGAVEKTVEEAKQPESPRPAAEQITGASEAREETGSTPAPAAPSVRRLARELGVNIHAVRGSGRDGRISQTDVNAYVKAHMTGKQVASGRVAIDEPSAAHQPELPDFSRWGTVRREKLETVRRLTAENTSTAWRIVPHVTQFDEADITDVQAFIAKHAKRTEKQGGKLTLTAVLMKVCAAALVRFPAFNASIDMVNEELIYKDYVHIGLAVDTPRGLLVPVIRDVQDKGIIDLAVEIGDAAQRARSKKIKPDEFEGASFTISNQGGIGGVGFTPVVVWPQAAILGISRARRMLVEKEGEFVPRTILPLSLSYDHRIVDGADAARFMDWICRSLEQGLTILL